MSEHREYTVESYNTDPNGRPQQSDVVKVVAATPKAAALKALKEELYTIGDVLRLRARVSVVNDVGFTSTTTFYSKG